MHLVGGEIRPKGLRRHCCRTGTGSGVGVYLMRQGVGHVRHGHGVASCKMEGGRVGPLGLSILSMGRDLAADVADRSVIDQSSRKRKVRTERTWPLQEMPLGGYTDLGGGQRGLASPTLPWRLPALRCALSDLSGHHVRDLNCLHWCNLAVCR